MNQKLKVALARVMKQHNVRRVSAAGQEHKSARVRYMKKNGEEIVREVQPYEVKPHRTTGKMMLYLTDDAGGPGQIKSYFVNRVRTVSKPLDEFEPNWNVQF